MKKSTRAACVLAALLAAACQGCSFSDSSESISKSVSSPFTSSSKSSTASSQRYEEDVRDYTAGYVGGGGSTAAGLRSGLASVASRHGVTNWEADMDTFEGIGQGLAKARVSQAQYQGYRDSLSGGDAAKAAAIDRGYESGGKD